MNRVAKVAAADWKNWVEENDAVVLDVREPNEWQMGTLPDAVLMSQGQIMERMNELPEDKPILCVCRSGARSGNVAAFLAFNGYEVANMAGGMKAIGMQD